MDNVGIVVEDIDAAIEFFTDLGLKLEGRPPIEGDWADGVTGLRNMRVEIAMMRTPDGHSRIEMSRFLAPPVVADHRSAPVNALGYLRVISAAILTYSVSLGIVSPMRRRPSRCNSGYS